ncbi:MAG: SET domain-containing protein-lysine N-methyltransferase [Patescibacteria group bacterium]
MPYPSPRPQLFPLRVGRSSSGFGVFAVEEIPAKKFIIEYWGKLVSDAVADRVGGRYLFDLENGNAILGGTRKNTARYINHACRPNAETRTIKNRIYVYSRKRIKAGDEITYNYGKEYFDDFIKPHGCRCPTCVKKSKRK